MASLPDQLVAALAPRYDVERELGRGGMATVYLARDTRHDRHVAVKVLDPELAASVGAERFLAEIRLTAQLHHPNILALFDSGEANGLLYYVMPYIAGETLRVRLERERQLPVGDAVRIATAIAHALEHAHKLGVVHRDLKPENILLNDGVPLVADFGIALALRRAGGERLTLTGLSLGTPHYMSPEQATGDRVIDGRSDVFSLGCVLFEMLAGETPFSAATAQATIARILTERPRDITAIRSSVPANVAHAIDRALEKLPADRWTSAREFADALSDATAATIREAAARTDRFQRWLPWAVAGGAVAAAAIAIASSPRTAAPTGETLRFPIAAADSERVLAAYVPGIPFAVSPDDRRIVYVGAAGQSSTRIYLRSLDELRARPLIGAEGNVFNPAFSPDGRWIAFGQDDRIVKLPVDGGTPTTLLTGPRNRVAGLDWFAPDTLVAGVGNALIAIPASGGTPVVLSRPDTASGEVSQWGPHVISDDWIAYTAASREGISAHRVALFNRKTKQKVITPHRGTTTLGAIDDFVLWVVTSGVVMAARLDPSGTLSDPFPVLEGVLVRPGGAAKAALSRGGSLLYEHGEAASQVMVVDQRGVATPFSPDVKSFAHPRWSPDFTKLAVTVVKGGTSHIFVADSGSRHFTQLTTEGLNDGAEWTPDSKQVIYRSVRPSRTTLNSIRVDGTGETELLGNEMQPYQGLMTNDGKTLVYRTTDMSRLSRHIMAVSLGGQTPRDLSQPGALDLAPRLSPDNKWLAYTAAAGAELEVYVQPFPGPGERYRVSGTGGGVEPMWSRDGHTVYYRSGREIWAATLSTAPTLTVTARTKLFEGAYLTDGTHASFDVMPSGKHLLMLQPVERQTETVMIHGWAHELRRRLK